MGDSVDLGLAEGTVEEVSLRVTRLRSVDGKIWYVPHGQITRVANLSQEWALVVVDVPVRRDADVAAATAAILKAADQVVDDPELGRRAARAAAGPGGPGRARRSVGAPAGRSDQAGGPLRGAPGAAGPYRRRHRRR